MTPEPVRIAIFREYERTHSLMLDLMVDCLTFWLRGVGGFGRKIEWLVGGREAFMCVGSNEMVVARSTVNFTIVSPIPRSGPNTS